MDPITSVLIAKSLDGLTARMQATAQNIANANSPGYRPVRVTFEEQLRAAAIDGARAIADVQPQTELAPMPAIASEMRLDLEMATASEIAMRYGALIDILGREIAIRNAVIAGGR